MLRVTCSIENFENRAVSVDLDGCWMNHQPCSAVRKLCLYALILCAMAATVQARVTLSPADVMSVGSWGALQDVKRLKHLYLAGQPDELALKAAKANGIEVVINLRDTSEVDWDEKASASDAGLIYYQVPIPRESLSFDEKTIARITSLVDEHKDQKILVHCSSGNRVSGWLAAHLIADHDMDVEHAVAIARKTGMTKNSIEAKVRDFAQKQN